MTTRRFTDHSLYVIKAAKTLNVLILRAESSEKLHTNRLNRPTAQQITPLDAAN
jgi:hypothetical protein